MSEPVTAAMLVIGNEILSGRTQDSNIAYIAAGLEKLGIRLREARVVADIEADIVAAVNALRERYRYVFTSGGIGPTHDDITAAAISAAFGVPLLRNPDAVRVLASHYDQGNLTPARLKMADMPEGSVLIDNPVSRAPGFQIGNVFVMAGVPAILRAMFDGLAGRLTGGALMLSRTISCGLAEGAIAADLEAIQDRYEAVEIGSYPYFREGKFGTSLVLRTTDTALLAASGDEVWQMIVSRGGTPVEQTAD
jgi:molybdenum cofactor synthesis domain-containing protein